MKKSLILAVLLSLSNVCRVDTHAEGSNGAAITLTAVDDKAGLYSFKFSGFSPGEKLLCISRSMEEVIPFEYIHKQIQELVSCPCPCPCPIYLGV